MGGPAGNRDKDLAVMTDSTMTSRALAAPVPVPGQAADPCPPAAEGQATLDAIRASIIQLLSCLARPASAVRVSVGDVTVELHWADPPATPAAGGGAADCPRAAPPAGPGPASGQAPQQADFCGQPQKPGGAVITAPTVGVFYRASEPGSVPFVEVGDVVAAGQQVAIVEAMKIMIPVEADRPGRIAEVLKADAEQVEYGEALFIMAPQA
jgi:acetyl-CoA carboxylase biotin carboxyl carrier protein